MAYAPLFLSSHWSTPAVMPRVVEPLLDRVQSAQSRETSAKTAFAQRPWVGSLKLVLMKTAFFLEAAGDQSHSPRKERRDAGCYHCGSMSRKTG